MSYTCRKVKNKGVYVYRIDEKGKKRRVKNDYATQCKLVEIPDCSNMCVRGRKTYTPCKKKRGIFINRRDVRMYCNDKKRTKGEYDRRLSERQRRADAANRQLAEEMKEWKDMEEKAAENIKSPIRKTGTPQKGTKSILKPSPSKKSPNHIKFASTVNSPVAKRKEVRTLAESKRLKEMQKTMIENPKTSRFIEVDGKTFNDLINIDGFSKQFLLSQPTIRMYK